VQEVRWDEGGSQPADDYTFLYGNGNANHHLATGFFIHNGITSAVKGKMCVREVVGMILQFIFGFALEYAITKVQEIQEGFKLNGPHQFLAHADSVNILDKNINACCHSFQNLLFCLIYRNWKLKIYKTIILPVALHGCKIFSHFLALPLIPKEKVDWKCFITEFWGEYLPGRREATGEWRKLYSEDVIICSCSSPNVIGVIKSGRVRGVG